MNSSETLDWSQLWSEIAQPNESKVIYRLYYDNTGSLLFYSMEDLPGNYIEITPQQFAKADSHVRVVNGQIVKIKRSLTKKLVPSADQDGVLCSPQSAAVIVKSSPGIYWKIKNYESD